MIAGFPIKSRLVGETLNRKNTYHIKRLTESIAETNFVLIYYSNNVEAQQYK